MSSLDTVIQDLVIANRILAKEDVVDAYGHVSIRHPDKPKHFFLARSLAPDLVERGDIVELGLDGQPVRDIADKFGDTDLLVRNMDHGRDLARTLGNNNVALMRGHGFASAARSLI